VDPFSKYLQPMPCARDEPVTNILKKEKGDLQNLLYKDFPSEENTTAIFVRDIPFSMRDF